MRSSAADPVVVSSEVPLPLDAAYDLVTRGMARWWPYGHRLGDVELAAVVLEAVSGGRWYQVDVHGTERDYGVVEDVVAPTRVSTRSFVGVGYAHDPRGQVTIDIDLRPGALSGSTTVTWTLSGFERLGAGGEDLRSDFAGKYGWRDMAEALARAVPR